MSLIEKFFHINMTYCQFLISGANCINSIELFNNKKGEKNNVSNKMVTN